MPWRMCSMSAQRLEFVRAASQPDANISALCRAYGISRKTGYKWLERWRQDRDDRLEDRSRRPDHQPRRSDAQLEAAVVAARFQFPTWGGRKLRRWLQRQGIDAVPSASTITSILRRHGLLSPANPRPVAVGSFEAEAPNDLWQLDFMGDRPLGCGTVYPFSVLDDHSRFALTLIAGENKQFQPVQEQLIACFRQYGLPARILSDNGPPWGSSGQRGLTRMEAWWVQLGITVSHGRFYHPQTQGKVERWHGTLSRDVFARGRPDDHVHCQQVFDAFRSIYNLERPHDALELEVPASRYQPSPRPYPEVLPPIIYEPDDELRLVSARGSIGVEGHTWFVGRGLTGCTVAVRPTAVDGVVAVYFAHQQVREIDLHHHRKV